MQAAAGWLVLLWSVRGVKLPKCLNKSKGVFIYRQWNCSKQGSKLEAALTSSFSEFLWAVNATVTRTERQL